MSFKTDRKFPRKFKGIGHGHPLDYYLKMCLRIGVIDNDTSLSATIIFLVCLETTTAIFFLMEFINRKKQVLSIYY
ncbi:MAG: hypothetical protein V3S69_05785 [Dehalococcoidales bacterium]